MSIWKQFVIPFVVGYVIGTIAYFVIFVACGTNTEADPALPPGDYQVVDVMYAVEVIDADVPDIVEEIDADVPDVIDASDGYEDVEVLDSTDAISGDSVDVEGDSVDVIVPDSPVNSTSCPSTLR